MTDNRRFIPGEGPKQSARILAIGENPWKTEIELGGPFKGASGNLWNSWLRQVGLEREYMRVDNVYPYKPPGYVAQGAIERIPAAELASWMEKVHEKVAEMPNLRVIVPMGNYATFALTGKGKVRAAVRDQFRWEDSAVSVAEKKAGITKLRGSVYGMRHLNNRLIKIIPTIHPAAVLQMQKWEKRCISDWRRIKEQSETDVWPVPVRNTIIDPSTTQIEEYIHATLQHKRLMAVDIETWGRTLSCCGFATSPFESITIPLVGGQVSRDSAYAYVSCLCALENEKILHNGLYDWYWLDAEGIELRNFKWDTLLMHHCFDPYETHSLDFLASIYTLQPYWKDEAKDAEEIVKYAKDLHALWVYNGLDCCVTHELQPILENILRDLGLLDFYHRHYDDMLHPCNSVARWGIRVDRKAQKKYAGELKDECTEIREYLKQSAGKELFATKEESLMRVPTKEEWEALTTPEWKILCGTNYIHRQECPKPGFIDKDARKRLNYVMTKGLIRDKKIILGKDFSRNKLMAFFHDELKLPKQMKMRKDKSKSTALNDAALRKLTMKFPVKIKDYGLKVLEFRGKMKEVEKLSGAWDSDGRVRCQYKMNTKAGRLSSSKNPMGKGYNLQNVKR